MAFVGLRALTERTSSACFRSQHVVIGQSSDNRCSFPDKWPAARPCSVKVAEMGSRVVESALQWSSWLNGAALPFTRSLKMLLPSSRENNHFPRCGFGRSWTTSTRAWAQKVCSPHPCSICPLIGTSGTVAPVDGICGGVACKSPSRCSNHHIPRG